MDLIGALADGQLHTGTALAARLGVSRSAVWKQVHQLDAIGLEMAVRGRRGYQLAASLELLDAARINADLSAVARGSCDGLQVVPVTESTNVALAAASPPAPGSWRALLAEYQTGGRGRRGRRWLSPFGSGLCLSCAWSFAAAPRDLPALSLAAGVAVSRALDRAGITGHGLKWPNDVLLDGAKLAGLLVDVDGDARGPLRAIVGIGINLAVSEPLRTAVTAAGGIEPAALHRRHPALARNALAAALLGALHEVLAEFSTAGFAPFVAEWRRHDGLADREVTVCAAGEELRGVARGIGPDGALLLEQSGALRRIFSGDVSLRAAA